MTYFVFICPILLKCRYIWKTWMYFVQIWSQLSLNGTFSYLCKLTIQDGRQEGWNSINTKMIISSSRGWTDQLFWTAEPPNPLSRDHTGYFGLPSLPAPFLDWAAAGADHTNFFGPPGGRGRETSYFGPPGGLGRADQLFWAAWGWGGEQTSYLGSPGPSEGPYPGRTLRQ